MYKQSCLQAAGRYSLTFLSSCVSGMYVELGRRRLVLRLAIY
jgi:hypothetical protein